MSFLNSRLAGGPALLALGLNLTLVPVLQAQVVDLSSSVVLPDSISADTPFTVTTGYANDGPDIATDAYADCWVIPPMGLAAFMDDLNNGSGSFYDEIIASATDTLGNVPKLFWDDFYCEHLILQLHGSDDPDPVPIQPLGPGESGSFSFELVLPMESPKTGTVEITSPAHLAKTWTLSDPSGLWTEKGYAGLYSKYGTTTCERLVGLPDEDVCDYIADNCWGTKVSHLDAPIQAQLELVDDGSSDPTFGCDALIGFTPGNIALVRRGGCEFGVKAFNAEQAGAVAVFMVNDGQCGGFPDSNQCVIALGPGAVGLLVTIPVIIVTQADGELVISAVENNENVAGIYGSATTFAAHGWTFLDSASSQSDPNDDNDASAGEIAAFLFVDNFESGDTSAWTTQAP